MAIIGEPISKNIAEEIDFRQKVQYKGLNNADRSPEHHQYLNNKTSWVKMASSVFLGGISTPNQEGTPSEKEEVADEIALANDFAEQRLKSIGVNPKDFVGNRLAKQFVLFNGVSEVGKPNQRSGIANNLDKKTNKLELWNSNAAYGLGGSNFGLQPIPGISDVAITCLNRGSIRKATISLKAHNRFQFEIIEMLYLRIGFHILLELGNDKYYDHKGKKYKDIGNTILENSWFKENSVSQLKMLETINTYRTKYSGNYDGFFGRVTNFTWDVTPEGRYNITIELHTVGDVVESIQVNFPASLSQPLVTLPSGSEKSVVEEAIENTLDAFLYKAEQEQCNDEENLDYINVNAIYSDKENELEDTDIKAYADLKQTKELYTKYIRFGELFNLLSINFLPRIKSEDNTTSPLIELNVNEETQIMGYHPNQTPLDPRVCTFKVPKSKLIENLIYPLHMESLHDFVFNPKEEIFAGKILNLYLNFNFVKKSMKKNINQEGKLSLFKFLQNLCNGINGALGNVNKLEPIIVDDNKISIIDQNPIPGLIESQNNTVEFQTFGYNQPEKSASIIKDINLTTSITPEMSTMVTIGATAQGSEVKGIDSTYFEKWNAGLNDRFNLESSTPEISLIQAKEAKKDIGADADRVKALAANNGAIIETLDDYGSNKIRLVDDDLIEDGVYTKQEFVTKKYIRYTIKSESKKNEVEHLLKQSYYYYLVKAFGSNSSVIIDNQTEVPPNPKSRFLEFNSSIIANGKNSYSEFLRVLQKREAKLAKAKAKSIGELYSSDQIGFIPFNLGITMEGLSGIKIYNKISIDQRFLPKNYPQSLHFISTQVNQYVRDNQWTTQLETIVLPKTKPVKYQLRDIEFIDAGEANLLPKDLQGPESGSGDFYFKYSPEFNMDQLVFPPDKNVFGDYGVKEEKLELDDVLKDIHPDVRGQFKGFIGELYEKYPGYYALLNSIYRTSDRSNELKKNKPNQSVARGGRSFHNYASAIDFNLVTPNGTSLPMKGDGAAWKNHGIPALAEKYGLGWGGDFEQKSKKEDAVHFYAAFDFKIPESNISLINKETGIDFSRKENRELIHKVKLFRLMDVNEIIQVFINNERPDSIFNDVDFIPVRTGGF